MSSFAITTPGAEISLSPKQVAQGSVATGTTSYSVTNQTGSVIRARLRIDVGEGVNPEWVSIQGGNEQEIGPGATASFAVNLDVPGFEGGGKRSFKAVVVNLADPDNDFAIGSAIGFDLPAVKEDDGGGIKWWMIAIPIALLVLVGAGLGLFFWLNSSPSYADYKGQELDTSVGELESAGYVVEVKEIPAKRQVQLQRARLPRILGAQSVDKFFKKIISDQSPDPSTNPEIEKGATVSLSWSWEAVKVTVPDVSGKLLPEATRTLAANALFARFDGVDSSVSRDFYVVTGGIPTGEVDAGTTITLNLRRRIVVRPPLDNPRPQINDRPNLILRPHGGD